MSSTQRTYVQKMHLLSKLDDRSRSITVDIEND